MATVGELAIILVESFNKAILDGFMITEVENSVRWDEAAKSWRPAQDIQGAKTDLLGAFLYAKQPPTVDCADGFVWGFECVRHALDLPYQCLQSLRLGFMGEPISDEFCEPTVYKAGMASGLYVWSWSDADLAEMHQLGEALRERFHPLPMLTVEFDGIFADVA